jgi:uncharacterized membrane protein
MNISDENEIKKEFQLERVIFFSDAVFAIIITIMILDVKLPEVARYPSEAAAKNAFLHLMPKLTGYAVSFFAVGNLWMKHLRIFSFLKDYNLQLITINLLFLFSVSLFPFALSFFFNSGQIMQYSWGAYTYVFIYYLTVFTQTMLIGYLIRNKHELCIKTSEIETVLRWKVKRIDYFILPLTVILIAVTSYFNFSHRISFYIVFTPLIVYNVLKKILKRKFYPNYKKEKVTLSSLFRQSKSAAHPAITNKPPLEVKSKN